MKKFKVTLPENGWKGLNTKNAPRSMAVGNDEFTAGSQNFSVTQNGVITKALSTEDYGTLPAPAKDLYEAVFASGERHLLAVTNGSVHFSTGNGVFTVANNGSGFASEGNFEFATYRDRVYGCNGVDDPIVYDKTNSYGGVSYAVPTIKPMGCQPPATAPTAVQGAAGNVVNDTYKYAVTFLYYDYEESNSGLVSSVVTVSGGPAQVNLTAIPVGGYGVTARKIYRHGLLDPVFRLVGTIPNNTTTVFTDSVATGIALIPTDNYEPPVFRYITQHKDVNYIAGIAGEPYTVRRSSAQYPDIFSAFGTLPCNQRDPIMGLCVYQDKVMVFNRSSFGYIAGTTFDTQRYVEIPGTVGCVDNRTIQVRVLRGVPILVWLSADGFYGFNGSSVEHMSENISDLIDVNLAQANYTKGAHTDTVTSDFPVPPAGSSLIVSGGQVTTQNPTYTAQSEADWEAGTTESRVATRLPSAVNKLTTTPRFDLAPAISSYTLDNMVFTGGAFRLNTTPAFYGETENNSSWSGTDRYINTDAASTVQEIAVKIVPPRNATITQVRFDLNSRSYYGGAYPYTRLHRVALYGDAGGLPGGVIAESPMANITWPNYDVSVPMPTMNVSLPVVGGTTYWLSYKIAARDPSGQSPNGDNVTQIKDVGLTGSLNDWSGNALTVARKYRNEGISAWAPIETNRTDSPIGSISGFYSAAYTHLAGSGEARSPIMDSGMHGQADDVLVYLNSFVEQHAYGNHTIFLEQSDSDDPLLFTSPAANYTVQSFLNATSMIGILFPFSRRFWRVRVAMTSPDNVYSPSVTWHNFAFNGSAEWVSPTIDKTIDVTAVESLTVVCSKPSGTGIAVSVLESNTDSNWNLADVNGPYICNDGTTVITPGPSVKRFSRIKLVLSSSGNIHPAVNSANMKWFTTAVLNSIDIDTGVDPDGWSLFLSDRTTPVGSSISFALRSDTVSPLTTTFHPVVVGGTPNQSLILPQQFAQWQATISAAADALPVLRDVTIQWYKGTLNSVRAASLIHKRDYFVSLAQKGSPTNDIILVLDEKNNWSKQTGVGVGTFSYFLGSPRAGSSSTGKVINWAIPLNASSAAINTVVRTKAFDFGDSTLKKVLQKVYLVGKASGQSATVRFSINEGQTWTDLVDFDGNTTFTLPDTGLIFTKRLVVSSGSNSSGTTIMLEVQSNDNKPCELHEISLHGVTMGGDVVDDNA